MKKKFNIRTEAMANLIMASKSGEGFSLMGKYTYELIKANGAKEIWKSKNVITTEGLNFILDLLFISATNQLDPWRVGIFTGFSGNAVDLIATDIGGALVEFTNYTGSRKDYVDARTLQTVSNTLTKAQFAILGSGTIQGSFLNDATTGVGTILLSVDDFTSGSRIVGNGDTLNVTYEVTAGNA